MLESRPCATRIGSAALAIIAMAAFNIFAMHQHANTERSVTIAYASHLELA